MRRLAAVAAAALALVLALGTASPVAAEGMPTNTKFLTPTSQEVGFGSPWFVKIQVRQNEYYAPLDGPDGTVDVFAEGIAEPLGDDLPLTRDGIAYFAQPADRPLLAAGTYVLSATFTPAAGTSIATSRTATPTTLVITPLGVSTSFEVIDDPARYAQPTVEARLGGAYVDATGQAPAGSWAVVVTDDAGSEVFSDTAAQAVDAAQATAIPLLSGLKQGKTYSVSATFTPTDALVGGLEVAASDPKQLTTAAAGALDGAVTPVSVPWWLLIALLAVTALLSAALVVLLVLGSRRAVPAAAVPALEPVAVNGFGPLDGPNGGVPSIGGPEPVPVTAVLGTEFFGAEFESSTSADRPTEVIGTGQPAFVDDIDPFAHRDTTTPEPPPVPPSEERKSWSLGDDRG